MLQSGVVMMNLYFWGFSRVVTAAMLESKNNETAAMLGGKTNPVGVELFSYVKTFFCYNKFAWLLVTWVKTVYWMDSDTRA